MIRKLFIPLLALFLGAFALVGVSAPANAAVAPGSALSCSSPAVTGQLSAFSTGFFGSSAQVTASVNGPGVWTWKIVVGLNTSSATGINAGSFTVSRTLPKLMLFANTVTFSATSSRGVTCSGQVTIT